MRDAPSDLLLSWYDRNARELPWRVGPAARTRGVRPDPYAVWLSEIMLQQTTVAAVRAYFLRFLARWPTVADLAAAEDAEVMAEWAGLGYYARARNLLKCARAVADDYAGRFPDSREGLLTLPGIGPYTAAAVSAIAFDRPETVVDGNVERVMARFFAETTPLPAAKPTLTARAAELTPTDRPGDYAQAVMDLGATICTPRSPACGICPLMRDCRARRDGIAAGLPAKSPKKPKPVRHGTIYAGRRVDGAWLLETRPASGLLGGMLGFPGSDWTEDDATAAVPPASGEWRAVGEVRHSFTHFHLILQVEAAVLEDTPDRGAFQPIGSFEPDDLPTLMRKVHDAAGRALASLEQGDPDGVSCNPNRDLAK